MPRKARQDTTSLQGLYHIVSRGNNQQRIFKGVRDYKKFLSILKETKKKYPFLLYSYNFLPNHYHLGLESQKIPISKIMHQINSSYVRYFRHRHGGSGHLFQERFFSSLVDKDSYLWELGSYIDLNAVRAGLVVKPEDWRWSSYLIYLQKDYKDDLMDCERFLGYIGEDLEKARLAYLDFVKDKLKLKEEPKFKLKFVKILPKWIFTSKIGSETPFSENPKRGLSPKKYGFFRTTGGYQPRYWH